MALDTSRAKAEIDTLAAVHTAAVRERDGQISTLRAEVDRLQAQLATLRPPPAPILWGSSVETRGQTFPVALARVEAALGRLDTVRYFTPGTGGPAWPAALTGLAGRGVVYSAKSPPPQVVTGMADEKWRAWFRPAVDYLGKWPDAVVDWTCWHEPEDDVERGAFTAAQWRTALARLIKLQRDEFAHPRLRANQILMGWTLQPGSKRNLDDYHVPEADVLGFDSYVGMAAGTPAEAVEPAVAAARRYGKRWAIAETGVSVALPDRAGLLTALATRLATADPPPVYVTYFSSDPGGPSEYRWPIDNDPLAAAAWLAGRSGR